MTEIRERILDSLLDDLIDINDLIKIFGESKEYTKRKELILQRLEIYSRRDKNEAWHLL